jgi:hypothetical protein
MGKLLEELTISKFLIRDFNDLIIDLKNTPLDNISAHLIRYHILVPRARADDHPPASRHR